MNFTAGQISRRVVYDVARSFYGYGAARQRVAISVQAKADSTPPLDAAEDRFRHGVGTSVETAQVRQVLAQAEFNRTPAARHAGLPLAISSEA